MRPAEKKLLQHVDSMIAGLIAFRSIIIRERNAKMPWKVVPAKKKASKK